MRRFDFSKEEKRLGAAMTGGSEGVPFIAQMHEFAMRESGIPGDEFYTDARKFVCGIGEMAERFGFDTPSFIGDVYNIEAQALGCELVTFKDMAPAIDNSDPLIKTESDLARLKAPDPYSSGRMPMIFEVLGEMKSQAGMVPLPSYCAPFTLASHVMTFENLIVQARENPRFVHRVMTFLVDEVIAPYLNAMLKEFPDATLAEGSDAVASPPFISQDMLEEFALGYIERLQKQAVRPAICDNWWGESFTDDLPGFWRLKLRATPNFLKVQDPDLFKIGVGPVIEFAKENDLPVILGVDNNVLQNGPGEEIEMRVHEYMEAIEEIGKGALYLCSLSAVTPAENVRIAIAAAHRFRAGDRPYAGIRRAGTPAARGEAEGERTQVAVKVGEAAGVDGTPDGAILDRIYECRAGCR